MSENNDFRYEALSADQRFQIVERRLQQYEAEHFEHSLNRRALSDATDVTEEERAQQLDQIDRTLDNLARSIELHRSERDRLAASAAAEQQAG